MADKYIINKDRFKMADETSSYIALTTDGKVSTTSNDYFFTEATNEYYVRFTHYMQNLRLLWRRGARSNLG